MKNVLLDQLITIFTGSKFIIRVHLSVSCIFLWLVLPVAPCGKVLKLHDRFVSLHVNKWRPSEFFLLLLDDKVQLCYSFIFLGVLVPLMELFVHFVVDNLCLFLINSQVFHPYFHVFYIISQFSEYKYIMNLFYLLYFHFVGFPYFVSVM